MTQSTVGPWAKHKLKHLQKYLEAYSTVLASYVRRGWFKGYYFIDAFAGPGMHRVRQMRNVRDPLQQLLPAFVEDVDADLDQREFLAGSPRIALQTQPPFTRYVFVETNPKRADELERLQSEFPDCKIKVEHVDCNQYLLAQVENRSVNWAKHRAIIFLDPFGMQVPWRTIQRLADTHAIEVLINFPEAMAIQRLLLRSGAFTASQRAKLDDYFGSADWYDLIFKKSASLFGDDETTKVDRPGIKLVKWYRERLRKAFGFASKAALIRNTRNGPLYYLILALPKQAGVKIANHILSAGETVD